jgi:hypothetical protein
VGEGPRSLQAPAAGRVVDGHQQGPTLSFALTARALWFTGNHRQQAAALSVKSLRSKGWAGGERLGRPCRCWALQVLVRSRSVCSMSRPRADALRRCACLRAVSRGPWAEVACLRGDLVAEQWLTPHRARRPHLDSGDASRVLRMPRLESAARPQGGTDHGYLRRLPFVNRPLGWSRTCPSRPGSGSSRMWRRRRWAWFATASRPAVPRYRRESLGSRGFACLLQRHGHARPEACARLGIGAGDPVSGDDPRSKTPKVSVRVWCMWRLAAATVCHSGACGLPPAHGWIASLAPWQRLPPRS